MKPQKLTKSIVARCLQNEHNWKPGDTLSFTYENYELTLQREEDIYAPFLFAIRGHGHFPTHKTQVVRRYPNMDRAFLHVLNRFNENVNIRNKYKSLEHWFDE